MGRAKERLPEWFLSDLSGLRGGGGDGSADAAKRLNDGLLSYIGLELHSRAIVGSAKLGWVLDIRHDRYLWKGCLSQLDCWLRWVNAVQASLNDWLESGRPTLLYSLGQTWLGERWWHPPEEPSEASIPSSYAVVVSALVLLSLVYQYLTGNVDRGGSKAYSRSSLDFRDVYVAIVLFLGAYVWIKFRAVAFRGVHTRKLAHKDGGTKKIYEARLKPPLWNGKKVRRLDLGQFATPQEAHNKFLIAAFYYNRDAGLLDGWFQVPPMSEEQSFTGEQKREWVIGQAKKVYEDFKKGPEVDVALLLEEMLGSSEDQMTPEQDVVNVDFSVVNLLNLVEHQQPTLVSQVENARMGVTMLDNHGLECASHSLDGVHEGLALPNDHSLGFQEGSTLLVSYAPPNSESGMIMSGINEPLDLLQTLVHTLQQQISLLQQQRSLERQQFSEQQRINQELNAQNLQLQHQQLIQQHQLQESRIQNRQWSCQFCLQQPQLQVINQGFRSVEVEMEQSMHQQNYSGIIMALPPDGGEVQETFF